MRRVLLVFAKNPVATAMFLLFFLTLGLFALFRLPLALMPETGRQGFTILTRHPGMDTEKMEEIITRPIEEAVSSLGGLKGIYSVSEESSSRIHLEFDRKADLRRIGAELRDQIEFASRHFPRDAEKPVLMPLDPNDKPALIFSLSGEGVDLKTLRGLVDEKLKPRLEKIEGLSEVNVSGGREREVNVLLNRTKMTGLGLRPADVVKSLQDQNVDAPLGKIAFGATEFFLRAKGRHESLEDIRKNPVPIGSGKVPLRLEELGLVDDGHKPLENLSTLNGEERVTLYLQASASANLVSVSSQVRRTLDLFMKDPLARGLRFDIIHDAAAAIREALSGLFLTLLYSAIIASLFLSLLLKKKKLLWIVLLALPAGVIPVFLMMLLAHLSLNVISLSGIGMGIGMTLDASIVVMDFLDREKKLSLSLYARALQKAAPPLFASTMTIVIIFLPLLLMNESESVIYRDLALTISFSLCFSLLFAFVLTAPLYRLFGRYSESKPNSGAAFFFVARNFSELSTKIDSFLDRGIRLYQKSLYWLRERPLPLYGSLFLFLALALAVFPFLPKSFRGNTSGNEILATLELPSGTSLSRTRFLAERAEAGLRRDLTNHLKSVQVKVETGQANFYITLENLSAKKIPAALSTLRENYRSFYEGFIHFTENTGADGNELEVPLELLGDDTEVLESEARRIAKSLVKLPGVEDLLFHFKEGRPVIQLTADRRSMGLYDLDPESAGKLFRDSLYGPIATKYLDHHREVDVRVKMDGAGLAGLDDLLSLRLARTNGPPIPLAAFVNVLKSSEKSKIYRKNKKRLVSMTLRRKLGDLDRFYKSGDALLAAQKWPEGVRAEWGGDFAGYQANKRELLLGILLAILLIYLLLASLYQDLKLPVLALVGVPLGLGGVVWVFFIFRVPLGISVYLGLMILSGLVVNHGILLVDSIRNNLKNARGLAPDKRFEAIAAASTARIRPILLTSGTSLIALLPVVFSGGSGNQWFHSLSITLFSGLLISLIASMFLIPILAEKLFLSSAPSTPP